MKKLLLLTVTITLLGIGCNAPQSSTPVLTLYTYESLNADYGLLPQVLPQFEQNQNVDVNVVTFPDAGALLNQLISERGTPKADIVIGLDNLQFPDVQQYDLLQSYKPARADDFDASSKFDNDFTLTAFDYGYVDFVYDTEALTFTEPISLAELADSKYKDKIIIEQPGLSSPGSQLLMWSHVALGDQANAFWEAMKANDTVLTVAPDWNTAYYSMFLNDQAPLVLSYITSPAYHRAEEGTQRYAIVPIKEGYLEQLEGMGIVKNSSETALAQNFIDYMLSDEVQNKIPTTQWMYPIFGNADMPQVLEADRPDVDQILHVTPNQVKTDYPVWLAQWNSTFGN